MELLLIIDCMRSDCISRDITPNLIEIGKRGTLKEVYTVNNNTEPCLAAIFSGVHPLDSGLVGLGQKDTGKILERITPRELKSWRLISPAIVFRSFTKFTQGRYIEDFTWDRQSEKTVFHYMGVHDYKDDGRWRNFYEGFEPLPKEKTLVDMSKAFGFGRPWRKALGETNNAGYLKAKYKGALHLVDEWVGKVADSFDTIILTADHGELWGENGVVFRHQTLHDRMVKVPLVSNARIEADDQTEILYPKKEKEYIVNIENTWEAGIRIDKRGEYLIHYWNKIFDLPDWEGNPSLKPLLLGEKERFPNRKPALLEGQEISIGGRPR